MAGDSGFEIREHTADILLAAWAKTPEGLLCAGAEGLYAILGDLALTTKTESLHIELTAPDFTDLYHDWLAELLFLFETKHVFVNAFHFEKLSDTILSVAAQSTVIQMDGSEFDCDVKAVTYHELEVSEENGTFVASVVLDL